MEIIAIINRKGGVGKTATAQALGAGLLKRGARVLFVDLDSQANLTYGMSSSPRRHDVMEVLTGTCRAGDAIQHTEHGDLLAGSESLAAADAIIDGTGKEYRLREALEDVNDIYDYVIIDTPAALGTLTVNALTAAAGVIIPVQADEYSILGIGQLNAAITAVRKYCNHDLKIYGILITRYNARSILSRDMQSNLQDAAAALNTKLYQTAIRECVSVKEAQACKQDIYRYAPRSNAAKDYEAFLDEFMQD